MEEKHDNTLVGQQQQQRFLSHKCDDDETEFRNESLAGHASIRCCYKKEE